MLKHRDLEAIRDIVKEEISGIQEEVSELRQEVADIRQEVADIRQEVADIRQEVADVRQEVADVRQEVADVRQEVADVRQELKQDLVESENLILQEVDRVHKIMNDKIDAVRGEVEEIKKYYQIHRLEQENTNMILQMVKDLTKRVELLEQKSA